MLFFTTTTLVLFLVNAWLFAVYAYKKETLLTLEKTVKFKKEILRDIKDKNDEQGDYVLDYIDTLKYKNGKTSAAESILALLGKNFSDINIISIDVTENPVGTDKNFLNVKLVAKSPDKSYIIQLVKVLKTQDYIKDIDMDYLISSLTPTDDGQVRFELKFKYHEQ